MVLAHHVVSISCPSNLTCRATDRHPCPRPHALVSVSASTANNDSRNAPPGRCSPRVRTREHASQLGAAGEQSPLPPPAHRRSARCAARYCRAVRRLVLDDPAQPHLLDQAVLVRAVMAGRKRSCRAWPPASASRDWRCGSRVLPRLRADRPRPRSRGPRNGTAPHRFRHLRSSSDRLSGRVLPERTVERLRAYFQAVYASVGPKPFVPLARIVLAHVENHRLGSKHGRRYVQGFARKRFFRRFAWR